MQTDNIHINESQEKINKLYTDINADNITRFTIAELFFEVYQFDFVMKNNQWYHLNQNQITHVKMPGILLGYMLKDNFIEKIKIILPEKTRNYLRTEIYVMHVLRELKKLYHTNFGNFATKAFAHDRADIIQILLQNNYIKLRQIINMCKQFPEKISNCEIIQQKIISKLLVMTHIDNITFDVIRYICWIFIEL